MWKLKEVIFNTNFNMSSLTHVLCGMDVKLAVRLGSVFGLSSCTTPYIFLLFVSVKDTQNSEDGYGSIIK